MLSGLVLENFKAFGRRQTIPFAPITLIFGPNSAGKSSILQALLLLKQTLVDPETGDALLHPRGSLVDVGSFPDFVFRHDYESRSCEITPLLTLTKADAAAYPNVNTLRHALDIPSITSGVGLRTKFDAERRILLLDALPVYFKDASTPAHRYRGMASFLEGSSDEWNTTLASGSVEQREEADKVLYSNPDWSHEIWDRFYDGFRQNVLPRLLEKLRAYRWDQYLVFCVDRGRYPSDEKRIEEIVAELREKYAAYEFSTYMEDVTSVFNSPHGRSPYRRRFLLEDSGTAGMVPLTEPWDGRFEERDLYAFLLGDPPIDFAPDLFAVSLELTQGLRRILERLVYLGPLREYPERYYLYGGSKPKDVGKSGRLLSEVLLSDERLIEQTNDALNNFGINYQFRADRLSGPGADDVFALRLVDIRQNIPVSLRDVGFGVGQVLPVIVQAVMAKDQLVLMEQPELHLHPRHQAALGTLLADAITKGRDNQFIVETHSEHLVLRLQRHVRRRRLRPEDVAILYVEPDPTGEETGAWVRHLRLDEEGDFIDDWPGGFFEESFEEVFGL